MRCKMIEGRSLLVSCSDELGICHLYTTETLMFSVDNDFQKMREAPLFNFNFNLQKKIVSDSMSYLTLSCLRPADTVDVHRCLQQLIKLHRTVLANKGRITNKDRHDKLIFLYAELLGGTQVLPHAASSVRTKKRGV